MHAHSSRRSTLTLALTLALTPLLPACNALVVGGAAVGGALLYSDRRSTTAQLEDEGIELRSGGAVKKAVDDRGHITVTSFNRVVLVTGQAPSEADKAAVTAALEKLPKVHSVVNELEIGFASSLTERSNDTVLTTKVFATLVDAGDVEAHAFKIVTERATVFLMGRVTEAEAERAVTLTRNIPSVKRVVKVFEILTPEELKALKAGTAK